MAVEAHRNSFCNYLMINMTIYCTKIEKLLNHVRNVDKATNLIYGTKMKKMKKYIRNVENKTE